MGGLSAALLLLAATALSHGYVYDREYRYHYHGYMHSGFPRMTSQRAGSIFEGEVVVQPYPGYYIIKIESPRVDRFNKPVADFMNIHDFEPRAISPLSEYLAKPIKVIAERGEIHHFYADRDDPEWSINIKKSLLSLLQLNLEQNNPVRIQEGHQLVQPELGEDYFRVMEKDIGGNCETSYIVHSHPFVGSPYNNHVLNVTKFKNYHNCDKKHTRIYHNFEGDVCVECDADKAHPVHGNSFTRYYLRGNRHHYVVENVTSEGELIYAPFTARSQTMEVFYYQTLTLASETDRQEQITLTSDTVPYYDLAQIFPRRYEFDEMVDLRKPHHLYYIYGYQAEPEQIYEHFRELITNYDDASKYNDKFYKQNFTSKYLELVRAVGTLGYEEVEQLYAKCKEQEKSYLDLFYQVLSQTGTNPAFMFMKYLIQSRRVGSDVAFHFIVDAPMHIKEPTGILFDEFYRLCDSEYVREYSELHKTCLFSFAHLVRDECIDKYDQIKHHTKQCCNPEKASKYYQYALRHYRQHPKDVFYVKLLGAFGVREFLDIVGPHVEGHVSCRTPYRVLSIYSLWYLGYSYPDQVTALLFPIFFNRTEDYEIRIAAFNLLSNIQIPLSHWEKFAYSLWDEPSTQVASFVYSTLQAYSKADHPCMKETRKYVRHALTILDSWDRDFSKFDRDYAYHYLSSGYNKKYGYGGFTNFYYVPSNSSYIPRSAYLLLGDYVVGHNYESFGLFYQARGLEKYFDKFLGPEGPNKSGHSFFDIFGQTRTRRDTSNVEKELNEIDKQIHIEPRDYEDLVFGLGVQFHNNYYHYYLLNESDFDYFFQQGYRQVGQYLKQLNTISPYYFRHYSLDYDKTALIFSPIGLPIMFDAKLIHYMQTLVHDFKLKTNPEIVDEEGKWHFPETMNMQVDAHIGHDRTFLLTFDILVPHQHVSYGVGIHKRSVVSLPTKVEVNVGIKDQKMSLKWTPINHHIFHADMTPFTYIDSHVNYKPVVEEETYTPVPQPMTDRYDHEYFHDALGVGVRVDADYLHDKNSKGDWYKFIFENDFREKYYYYRLSPEFRPYHVDVYITPSNRDMTNEFELMVNYNYYHPQSTETYVPTFPDGFEEQGRSRADMKWETHVIKAELQGRGQRERNIKAEMSFSQSSDQLYHKWNLYYDRSPFSSKEAEHFKLCLSNYFKYPKYDISKIYSLETAELDHTMNSVTQVNFGRDCSTDSKLSIQGHFERSSFQRKQETERETTISLNYQNSYGYYYQKCKELQSRGIKYNNYCDRYIDLVTKLHKQSWDIKYENLHEHFYNLTYRLSDAFKHWYYPYMQINHLATNEPGMLKIYVENFVEHQGLGNIAVYKPYENVHYNHVPFRLLRPVTANPLLYHSDWAEFLLHHRHPHCLVHGDYMRTFDNYSYVLPEINCHKILAKDCSPLKEFTILGAKVYENDKYTKALKMFVGGHKVEGLPTAEGLIIRLDGTRLTIPEDEPYSLLDSNKKELFHIHYNGYYYSFISDKYALKVFYDGNAIFIKPGYYYRGKLCGLCGDYNGDVYDELKGPDGCAYNNTDMFSYSYAILDPACSVPKVYGACDSEFGWGCTLQRTHYIHVGSRNRQTCFSVTPVTRCAEGCKPTRHVTRSVGYHCLPAREDFTRYLMRESETRVLHELRRKSQDHFADVDFPESCTREL